MKTVLMAVPQQLGFAKDLFTLLESRYEGLNMQTATNNGEMADMLKKATYDLAIVNSDEDALALSSEIIASGLSLPIIVYTKNSYIPFIKQLYGAGVSGVLNIGDGSSEILKAVADVLAKRIYMSETLKHELLKAAMIEDLKNSENFESANEKSHFCNINTYMPLTFIDGRIAYFTECLN